MAKPENNDDLRRRNRFTTLLPSEHLRRSASQAEKQLAVEQKESVVSIAQVLDEINEVETRADLHTRIVMLEEQVERLNARTDDVDPAIESKLSVLRTTIESAMEAIVAPAVVEPEPGAEEAKARALSDALDGLRAEFESKLLEARNDLRFEILKMQKDLEDPALVPADAGDLDDIREDFQARIAASEERSAKAIAQLEDSITAQQEELDRLKARHAELLGRLSKELAGFAQSLGVSDAFNPEPGSPP